MTPGALSMQRIPDAAADGNSREKNSLIAAGVGMEIGTQRRYRGGTRSALFLSGFASWRSADHSALSGVTRSSIGITLPLVTIAMCSNCERMYSSLAPRSRRVKPLTEGGIRSRATANL